MEKNMKKNIYTHTHTHTHSYINDNPLLYSCLGNPKDRGAWKAITHAVTKELDMILWLNNKVLLYSTRS